MTPRNGQPLVVASQDFLSASYLLTQNDRYFTHEQFCTMVAYFGDAEEHIDIPPPTIIKPIQLWTGKQIFSSIIRPNKDATVRINFETKETNYDMVGSHSVTANWCRGL